GVGARGVFGLSSSVRRTWGIRRVSCRDAFQEAVIRLVVPLQPGDCVEDAVDARQVMLLDHRRRVWDVPAGDSQYRRRQRVEAPLLDACGDLRAHAGESGRFRHDDTAPGLAYGLGDCLVVKRNDRAQVDDLEIPALAGGGLGGLECYGNGRAV